MHHYRHHIGDYRKDTAHLSLLEHGVYRQALDLYYLTEAPLTTDMRQLMRLLCVRDASASDALANVLADFFVETERGYEHARCERELQEIYAKSEKARTSAKKRWGNNDDEADPKKSPPPKNPKTPPENANAMRTHDESNANASDQPCERNANGMLPSNPEPTTHIKPSMPETGVTDETGDGVIPGYKNHQGEEKPKTSTSKPDKKAPRKKYKFSDDQYQLAVWMSNPVKKRFGEAQKIDLEQWADAVRKLMEIDGYTEAQIQWLWRAVTTDERQGFNWSTNCRTPMKLRESKQGMSYFEIIKNQFTRGHSNAAHKSGGNSGSAHGGQSLTDQVRDATRQRLRDKGIDPET